MPSVPTAMLELADDTARPYFLWWTDATVAELRRHLRSTDAEERAYWMGALLREANSRDVWSFVKSSEIRRDWPQVARHLGRSRAMWAWLLQLPDAPSRPTI